MTYQSKPGDARRQGRPESSPRKRDLVRFTDGGVRVFVMLGVVTVGEITINPAGGRNEFLWSLWLPMLPRTTQPAGDLDAAKRAASYKVKEWIEAAGLKGRGE